MKSRAQFTLPNSPLTKSCHLHRSYVKSGICGTVCPFFFSHPLLFILSFVFWTETNAWIHCISVAKYLCHVVVVLFIVVSPCTESFFSQKTCTICVVPFQCVFNIFLFVASICFCVIWGFFWCWLWFYHSKSLSREIDNVDSFVSSGFASKKFCLVW